MQPIREPYWQQLDLTWYFFDVGDVVEIVKDIYEGANDHSPGGYYANVGDKVIIKSKYTLEELLKYPSRFKHPFSVAHEWVTNNACFVVGGDEIAPWIGYSPAKALLDAKRQEDFDFFGSEAPWATHGWR